MNESSTPVAPVAPQQQPIFENVDVNALVENALKRKDSVATLLPTPSAVTPFQAASSLVSPNINKSEPPTSKIEVSLISNKYMQNASTT